MKPRLFILLPAYFLLPLFGWAQTGVPEPEDRPQGELIAERVGCYTCHTTGEKKVGPTFPDIAVKAGEALEDDRPRLRDAIKYGSKGNWTEVSRGVPMPPYQGRLSEEEIQVLVDWIMEQQ